ncbi:hypothetical protein CLAFUW4_09018 [Fulvia fulva]|uniref:Averufin oxidase A n=1 Tax=Passalora fulva TaxID=5499 RepID=A0A9Q8UT55_PASFU|nr:Averufin oxidase A [Fulvia fulva]KAK4613935.1 hypothetical protein CLAFUR4_09024 [Fulvia fulva]KAK4614504.1 hypothetical protein CLAFUR0_09016 [Fulvia fulva]UJO21549.1 Averufin oxidase A [Fulvia fulva]WPV20648.1 hypothetical protein CLAFUW4_09018 [Fulvia fulva]WPV34966.1 hypothetical protein CLAFUW7_09019 [Fulvia fulva]
MSTLTTTADSNTSGNMVKYALCRATGATGKAILRALHAKPLPALDLSIYIRNKSKLLSLFPTLESSPPFPTTIYEGSNTNTALWKQCLRDVNLIMMCIASNVSKKGETRFTETASAVVKALEELRQEQKHAYKTPSILILRASILNERFNPGLKQGGFMFFCLKHLYDDMVAANRFYESKANEVSDPPGLPKLLEYIYVDPPSIHDAEGTTGPTGYRLNTEPGNEASGELSYADLGASFGEIAERREEYKGLGVSVTSTGKTKTTWPVLMSFLAQGAAGRVTG